MEGQYRHYLSLNLNSRLQKNIENSWKVDRYTSCDLTTHNLTLTAKTHLTRHRSAFLLWYLLNRLNIRILHMLNNSNAQIAQINLH